MASTTINNLILTGIPFTPTDFVQTELNLKPSLEKPTFTRTMKGITTTMVGLESIYNTTNESKRVSRTEQTALDIKAQFTSSAFTRTKNNITSENIDKPVSTAQQTALDLKVPLPMIVGSSPTSASGTIGQIVVHNEILYMCIKSYVNSESGAVWCVIYIDSFIR